jgi:hypothetical protein
VEDRLKGRAIIRVSNADTRTSQLLLAVSITKVSEGKGNGIVIVVFLSSAALGWAAAAARSPDIKRVPFSKEVIASTAKEQNNELKRLQTRNRRLEALVSVLHVRQNEAAMTVR